MITRITFQYEIIFQLAEFLNIELLKTSNILTNVKFLKGHLSLLQTVFIFKSNLAF